MDILTHTITGVAAGTVIASFVNKGFGKKLLIIIAGGFGALLPDIDALSLWSGFDASFGKLFGLSHAGRHIYSAKFWYSHHAFFHSFFAGLLIAFTIGVLVHLVHNKFKNLTFKQLSINLKNQRLMLISFILGFTLHLMQDMPTPSSSWGGVNFFWPSSSYIGGSGHIWWWNNYDIFIIVITVTIINTLLLCIKRLKKSVAVKIITSVFIIGFLLCAIQINTRDYNFNYANGVSNYQEHELKSKQIQKRILGDSLFNLMVTFDNKLKIYF